jgi:hypothetical protein
MYFLSSKFHVCLYLYTVKIGIKKMSGRHTFDQRQMSNTKKLVRTYDQGPRSVKMSNAKKLAPEHRSAKNSDPYWTHLMERSNEMCAYIGKYNKEMTEKRIKEDADKLLNIIFDFNEGIEQTNTQVEELKSHLLNIMNFFAAVRDTVGENGQINNVILYFETMKNAKTQKYIVDVGFGCHRSLNAEIDRLHEQTIALYRSSIGGHSPYMYAESTKQNTNKRLKPNPPDNHSESNTRVSNEEFSRILDRERSKHSTSGVSSNVNDKNERQLPPHGTPRDIRNSVPSSGNSTLRRHSYGNSASSFYPTVPNLPPYDGRVSKLPSFVKR